MNVLVHLSLVSRADGHGRLRGARLRMLALGRREDHEEYPREHRPPVVCHARQSNSIC
jgi:hypothetical protein